MLTEQQKMEALINLSMELNQVKDIDILLEHILTSARTFANADAGSIYLKNGDKLKFSYTQNDTLQKRLSPDEKLIYNIFEIPVNENSLAGYATKSGRLLNIDDTGRMDTTLPYHFDRSIDDASGYWTHSILTIPLQTVRGDIVGVIQLINRIDEEGRHIAFSPEIGKIMTIFAGMAAIAIERARMTRDMILRTIRMAEMRDPKETGSHVNRVAGFTLEIYEAWAKSNGISKKEVNAQRDILTMAAMLHDVGKVSIADAILKKPGKLNEEEYEIMKQHTISGARLFLDKTSDFDVAAITVALNHHERWDGKGYPGWVNIDQEIAKESNLGQPGKTLGKAGKDIPLHGRITAIADVFDALSSKRCYKEPFDEEKVLKIMEEGRGTNFDPELLDLFFLCLPQLRIIQNRYQEEETKDCFCPPDAGHSS